MRRRDVLVAVGAVGLAGTAIGAGALRPTPPDATLVDDRGRPLRFDALVAERTVAINFIFTGCASFCPPQTAIFRAVRERWGELGHLPRPPLLLSISIDPFNDSPQAIAAYARRYDLRLGVDAGWLILTGEVPQVERVLRAFGTGTGAAPQDHAPQLWVGTPARGRWLASSGMPAAADVLRMMREVGA
ncbi:MAG: SCO family protein [Variovorax sp.]|jgi:protein SCO1/2|nr:MAG: SCO family protein [Variovorax sp.]